MNPLEIVQKQVFAYNSRDIEAFAACHHPDVELFSLGNEEAFVVGNAQLKTRYKPIFDNSPELHTEVVERMQLGNTVIDKEIVTGRNGQASRNFIAIYHIKDGLIFKVYFVTD